MASEIHMGESITTILKASLYRLGTRGASPPLETQINGIRVVTGSVRSRYSSRLMAYTANLILRSVDNGPASSQLANPRAFRSVKMHSSPISDLAHVFLPIFPRFDHRMRIWSDLP